MKIINLDELELKCIEFGIKNNFFTKEDLADENLFTIKIDGKYQNKSCAIWFKGNVNKTGLNEPINFEATSWEKLYYQLDRFFSETWEYSKHKDRLPLYIQIAELIGKQSKNGFVNASEINRQIRNLL